MEQFPMTATGKISRAALKDLAESQTGLATG
jgi:acyl-coenzyme A synthetase/AMP-(fatty) acid ligase